VDHLPDGLPEGEARGWFAPHPLAATLVMSRSLAYGTLATVIDIDMLSSEEAYQLLTNHRPPLDEQDATRRIVAELGGHALVVDVCGAALRNFEGAC
jgi:hypothetical protein